MASAASPSWVILGSVPRVLSAATDLPPGVADFSLALPAPPRVALLTIPARIYPDRASSRRSPTIIAADPSGLLLLHSEQGRRAAGPTIIDTPHHRGCSWWPYLDAYFLLDATATTASAFPLPKPELLSGPGFIGLIDSPRGYVVAELQPVFGSDKAVLLRFSSQNGEWVSNRLAYPLPCRRFLGAHGVLSCSGRLWWVDLSWCLLTCDPFADAPVLDAVHLPEGKALKPSREASGLLDKYRCVGVSAGKLRFVDMYRNRNSNRAAQISVWTLADHSWTLEYEATFAEICDHPSYKATGLPRKIPVLALIHPTNPDVVYFFLDGHLFGVDVRARKVVHCEVYELVEPPMEELVEPPMEDVASRYVQAWQLPPALRSGSAKETDDGVDEELQRLHLGAENEE